MSKYIIELFDGVQVLTGVGASPSGTVWSKSYDVDELEELNSDYINEHFGELQDEAYQRGINDGSLDVKQRVEGAYQRGLGDAWKLAEDVIYNRGNVLDILHCATVGAAFDKYSAEQALDILRTYEHKQKEKARIEVGDIVEVYGNIGVVTYMDELRACVMMVEDGSSSKWNLSECKKTGKHYDIASILEAMRE